MAAKAAAAAAVVHAAQGTPDPASSPKMQRDIHFVLRVEANLRPAMPAPSPFLAVGNAAPGLSTHPEPTAGTPEVPQPAAQAPAVNPDLLSLQLRFTPWTGQEVVLEPASLTELGQLSPPRASTPTAATAGRASVAAATSKAAAAPGKAAAPAVSAAVVEPNSAQHDDTQPPAVSVFRWWCSERHFKLTVDEACVRAMADAHGMLNLPVTLTEPPAEPPPKPVKGQPPPPEPQVVSFTSVLPVACAGLLVGETQVDACWPSKLQPLPAELGTVCDSLRITLRALSLPQPTPEEEAAAAATAKGKAASKAAPAKGAKGGKDVAPEPDLSMLPGEPTAILTPALASRLNPLVVMPLRANALPDAPATSRLLDTRCEPVRLHVRWPPGGTVSSEQVGRPSEWRALQPRDSRGPGLACRAVGFGRPLVLLAGDQQLEQVLRWCKESPLTLEVHDRTIIPDPPEFPIKQAEGAAAQQQEDEGYVCGIARIPLLDLVRGRTALRFAAPLAPHTTIRGAASLDWGRRPGNYAASAAVIKGWVRCAVPLTEMVGVSQLERVFTRAVFTMDYRDSELFHLLEDTIRRQNAWALGLAAPVPQEEPAASPPKAGSNHSSAHNSRHSTPSRTHNSDSEGGANAPRATTSHSTHSVVPNAAKERRRKGTASTANDHSMKPAGLRISQQRTFEPSLSVGPTTPRHGGAGPTTPRHASPGPTTPRQLRGMERNSSIGTGPGGAPAGGPRVVLWSAPHSTTGGKQQDRKELRFHAFGSAGDSGASSDDSDAEEPQSAVELALDAALEQLETVKLDNRLIQTLSTIKLSPEQSIDPQLELLTGWHLVDNKERVIAVEGRSAGAMAAVQAIIAWALEEPKPEDGWLRRGVLHNSGVAYASRLWADLGVDLHIVKLHAPLNKIIADAASYATGKVRVDCIAGLRRLSSLRALPWARLADELGLYPTPHMLHLVDKKFGGELTKADVFGVEAEEFDTDEEDGGGMGLVNQEDARSSHSSSKRSARSARSRKTLKSRKSGKSKSSRRGYMRKRPALLPLERHNEAYILMREQARAQRLATDWHAHNLERVSSLAGTAAAIRAEWAKWNPQREAARQLEEAFKKGTMRLEDTRASHTSQSAGSRSINAQDARLRGWAPHTAAFKWPAPKDPGSYAVHPHAPSMFRQEQLAEPWEENTAANTFLQQGGALSGPNFITTVKNQTGLFGQDPDYWKTVHMGGTGRMMEEAERKAAEKAEWARKLVDEPVMHVTLPVRPAVSQTDRVKHILLDEPRKKGLIVAHVPPAPYSMHTSEPWQAKDVRNGLRAKDNPQKFLVANTDFKRHLALLKSAVSKPGKQHLQSWTAATHDLCYNET